MGSAELTWSDIDLRKITEQAWDKVASQAEALKARAEKLHRRRCQTGSLPLQKAYERTMGEYALKMQLLRMVAPGYIERFRREILAEAARLERKADALWRLNERSPTEATQRMLEETMGRHIRLLDQASALGDAQQTREAHPSGSAEEAPCTA